MIKSIQASGCKGADGILQTLSLPLVLHVRDRINAVIDLIIYLFMCLTII